MRESSGESMILESLREHRAGKKSTRLLESGGNVNPGRLQTRFSSTSFRSLAKSKGYEFFRDFSGVEGNSYNKESEGRIVQILLNCEESPYSVYVTYSNHDYDFLREPTSIPVSKLEDLEQALSQAFDLGDKFLTQ